MYLPPDSDISLRDPHPRPKPKRRRRQDGDQLIAPDGEWAWVICIAAGIINLSSFPIIQQFGLIFGNKFPSGGISMQQIISIVNTQSAVSACTGLLNGFMFEIFSFRQTAIAGSVLMFVGLIGTAFSDSYLAFLTSFSIVFGFGLGIILSASSLAMDTYFKFKRPRATGYSWTITGLGPIVFPYLIPLFVRSYGVQGTVEILAAFSLHAFLGALTFQPVKWHAAPPDDVEMVENHAEQEHLCQHCEMTKRRNTAILPDQYLYHDDEDDNPGFEITDPGTPMLARANDGWFGVMLGLCTVRQFARLRTISVTETVQDRRIVVDSDTDSDTESEPGDIQVESIRKGKAGVIFDLYVKVEETERVRCTCQEERDLLRKTMIETREMQRKAAKEQARKLSIGRKLVLFLGLNMLRDPKYVALVIGLTLINFAEFNFTILTPFILSDFGFEVDRITTVLTVFATTDLSVRYIIPFLTERLNWDNRVFFSLSALGIVLGRTMVALSRNYSVVLSAFVWLGIHKGVRTTFLPLILPCCISLDRLPAASGLALTISGIFFLIFGSALGKFQRKYGFVAMIHMLNCLTVLAVIIWITDCVIRICRKVRESRRDSNPRHPAA